MVATLLCSLVAGFVFAFALVVMPGLGRLDDREFLRGFQVIDRVIQENHPAFVILWVGAVVALAIAGFPGFSRLDGPDRLFLIGALLVYFGGVQLPTITINVPLNNQLQALDVHTMGETELAGARARFEPRWNRIRTILAGVTSVLLLLILLRL